MFKLIVIVSLLTFIEFSTENVTSNTELDKKLSKMWAEVHFYENRTSVNSDPNPLKIIIYAIDTNVSRRFYEHFNKIEEHAQNSGKLENVLVDSVYFQIIYEEVINSNIIPLLKEEIKKLYKDNNVQQIILQLFDNLVALFHDGCKTVIQEMKSNPRQIFEEKTIEELEKDRKKYDSLKKIYYDKKNKNLDDTFDILEKIGKESELKKLVNFMSNLFC